MCVLAAAKLIDAIGGNRGRAAKLVRRNSLPNLGIDPKDRLGRMQVAFDI